MRHSRSSVVTLVTATVLVACAPAVAQQTSSADAFVDSVGVNIHLHYTGTAYWDQFPLIRSRLVDLGVRHVRDGLIDPAFKEYYERFISLAQAGIKGTFITSPDQTNEVWASWPSRVGSSFEAYEAPNEYDKSKDPNWAQTLTQTLVRLRRLKDDPRAAPFPLYGPSLTSEAAYSALGNVSALYDYGNMHNYFAGRDPGTTGWGANGYGSIAWNLDVTGRHGNGKPIVATETGYQDTPSEPDSIPPRVVGRYMPRVLLEHFRAGIVRTFLYELCDFANSGGYGLLNPDASPKPAYTAVKGLLNLLSDPGPTFTPQDLQYTVQGGSADVRHMAFQKRSGTYFVALWRSIPSWDPPNKRPLITEPTQVMVRLPSAMRLVRTHKWQPDGSVTASASSTSSANLSVTVTDALTILELTR
jgi:hypothetical protein